MKMQKEILVIDHEGDVVHMKFKEDGGNEFQKHPLLFNLLLTQPNKSKATLEK
jgi:hypothetical protein